MPATSVRSSGVAKEPTASRMQWRGKETTFLREVPIGGQNDDLGGVFVTSFEEGAQHVAPALPENS